MNKLMSIAVAIGISAFLATNLYLLFSDKTVIPKSVHINAYERMKVADYSEKLPKEALVAPMETSTVYIGSDDSIDSWLVTEGDAVYIGDELALLNTERADGQRNTWETERTALYKQEKDVEKLINELSSAQKKAKTASNSKVDRGKNKVTEVKERTTIELGIGLDLTVDVTQEGSYAQAIAAAEQELMNITRQLTVLDAQLGQDSARPAVISPVEGIVSKITRHGPILAVDIYSTQRVLTTYVKDNEWKKIEVNDRVLLKGEGIEDEEGTVLSVSAIPTPKGTLLDTYKLLDPIEATNPLAYYEVRISTDADLDDVPFGNNMRTVVITDEALDAFSVNKGWLRSIDEAVQGTIIDSRGKVIDVSVTTSFTWKNKTVVTEGIYLGDIVVKEADFRDYDYAPRAFLSMSFQMPKKAEWRQHGWRNYLKHVIVR